MNAAGMTLKWGIIMRKPTKKIYVALTDSDRELLNSYCMFSSCLSTYLGDAYEIVVHSFGEGDRFILKIINGGLSGRTADDKIPDSAYIAVEQLELRVRHGDPPITVSFSVNPDGRKFKSASIGIVGSQKRLIGMLCINCCLDVPFSDIIRSFALPSYLDSASLPLQVSDSSRYDTALTQTITKVRDSVMNDPDIPAKFKRKEIVRQLNDSGVFKVKNAIQICAETLGITIATIYMHIRNLDTE